jgi:hypothetical protein
VVVGAWRAVVVGTSPAVVVVAWPCPASGAVVAVAEARSRCWATVRPAMYLVMPITLTMRTSTSTIAGTVWDVVERGRPRPLRYSGSGGRGRYLGSIMATSPLSTAALTTDALGRAV